MSRKGSTEPQDASTGGGQQASRPLATLVSRLIGLETEYAPLIIDRQRIDGEDLPAGPSLFDRICDVIRRDQPTAVGVFDNRQLFLASGGAVTRESASPLDDAAGGFIEFATPEVRSPAELLACQRSIDALAATAAGDATVDCDVRLLKNNCDARGHVYGCQENYEAEVARGIWLWIYRAFILLLWFMQVITTLITLPLVTVIVGALAIYRKRLRLAESATEPQAMMESIPSWLSRWLISLIRLIHLPTVLVLRLVARHIAFRRQRKFLAGFLVSRVALCGSGNLQPDGRYHLSAKAMAIDTIADLGGFRGERPIFVYGHWLSQLCEKSFLSLGSARQLLRAKQRLQIGLSDSNMSDLAEYVKVGATSLLLDLIEAGATKELPRLKRPLFSLHHLARDWNLIARVPTKRGEMSAIDLQRAYLKAARSFVDSTPPEARGEAPLVLNRWSELLNSVIAFRQDARDTESAIGRVDWLTKRWMIDQLGSEADWSAKKKIDLRYHELSESGYYQRLLSARPELHLVDDGEIDRRRKSPPASSPAARRGWLIREFADSDGSVQLDWSYALIGRGKERKRFEFSDK